MCFDIMTVQLMMMMGWWWWSGDDDNDDEDEDIALMMMNLGKNCLWFSHSIQFHDFFSSSFICSLFSMNDFAKRKKKAKNIMTLQFQHIVHRHHVVIYLTLILNSQNWVCFEPLFTRYGHRNHTIALSVNQSLVIIRKCLLFFPFLWS